MKTKDHLLRLLTADTEVSGETAARELGVSRNAVWKAVTMLRAEGYRIEAATNRGYRLAAVPDLLSEAEIHRMLTTRTFGRHMEIHGSLDSTNSRAKALAADGAPEGTLVIADSQTRGRGRMGRAFFSPPHAGIYMSLILRPDCPPGRASLITSMAAVAVARAVEAMAVPVSGAPSSPPHDAPGGTAAPFRVSIKWVNDLYIGDKKICGILSEAGMGMEAGRLDYVVVGIGVNVAPTQFPPELRDIASSIGNETACAPSRNALIAEIANRMEPLYGQLETGAFLAESRSRSNVIGRHITVMEGGRQYPAFAEDIDEQGYLVIRTEDGRVSRLGFGEVSIRR